MPYLVNKNLKKSLTMKYLFSFLIILTLTACNFGNMVTNEESEKIKGEEVADLLYDYISQQKFDGSIEPYISKEFQQYMSVDRLDKTLKDFTRKLGKYEDKSLTNWTTQRHKETGELWECVLQYSVSYENGYSFDIIRLVKENDSVKILSFYPKER